MDFPWHPVYCQGVVSLTALFTQSALMTVVLLLLAGWMLISGVVLVSACAVSARFPQDEEHETAAYLPTANAYGD
jgi:hypothetical protein